MRYGSSSYSRSPPMRYGSSYNRPRTPSYRMIEGDAARSAIQRLKAELEDAWSRYERAHMNMIEYATEEEKSMLRRGMRLAYEHFENAILELELELELVDVL